MKTVKDKYLVVGADFAGFPLKEAVVKHLQEKGWHITDLGVTKDSDPNDTENMFHRVGLRVGAQISEGFFERACLCVIPNSLRLASKNENLPFLRSSNDLINSEPLSV